MERSKGRGGGYVKRVANFTVGPLGSTSGRGGMMRTTQTNAPIRTKIVKVRSESLISVRDLKQLR